jgi:hypothetical protein
MYATTYFNPNAVGLAYRFQLHVAGLNFSNHGDVTLGPVQISLQGPGGQSTMRFTVERVLPPSGSVAPFRGRTPVYFYDSQSDLEFRGYIVHTTTRRSQGTKQIIDVDVVGLEKLLDERLVVEFKTRTDTNGRVRKIAHDDNIIKGILQYGSLPHMFDGGFVQLTNSDMDNMHFSKQTVRQALDEVCDIAQEANDYRLRRYYVDGNGQLHYYKDFEGLPPPYFINEDDRYVKTMLTASGMQSFWSGRLLGNGNVDDHLGNATATLNGGVVADDSLCIGALDLPGLRFGGATGYLTPSASNLHPGNTGSWGCVFKRRISGSQQALISGGSGDILIGFDANDKIRVQKEGTGNGFLSDTAYTSLVQVYHLVVTHSGANSFNVYVNGSAITGTTTAQTLVADTGVLSIGRKKSTTDQYYAGTLWGAWVSSTEFSAATVLAQYKVWRSIEPENLVVDRDSTDVTLKVWVTGSKAVDNIGDPKSAWVYFNDAGDPNFEQVVTHYENHHVLQPEEFLDAPDADTINKRKKYGHSYMAAKAGTVVSASFSLSYDPALVPVGGVTTWTPGQTCFITSQDAQGWTAKQLEVKQVDVDLLNASGEIQYTITAGALPYSGLRHMRARSRGMA